jgi:hypothetical protein
MEVAAPPSVVHASPRAADPQDPPREMSGLAWGAMVSLGLVGILSLIRIVADLELRSAAGDGGDVAGAYDAFSVWVGLHGLVTIAAAVLGIMVVSRMSKRLDQIRSDALG